MGEVPFTQFMRPDGRRRYGALPCSDAAAAAAASIEDRVAFSAEVLRTGDVCLWAEWRDRVKDDEDGPLANEVVPNGPGVTEAVERLVHRAAERVL